MDRRRSRRSDPLRGSEDSRVSDVQGYTRQLTSRVTTASRRWRAHGAYSTSCDCRSSASCVDGSHIRRRGAACLRGRFRPALSLRSVPSTPPPARALPPRPTRYSSDRQNTRSASLGIPASLFIGRLLGSSNIIMSAEYSQNAYDSRARSVWTDIVFSLVLCSSPQARSRLGLTTLWKLQDGPPPRSTSWSLPRVD